MKRYLKSALISSLAINIFLLGCFAYAKRASIKNRFESFSEEEIVVADEESQETELQEMNNVFSPAYIDTCNSNSSSGGSFKLLLIGNSLSHHGIDENIGWKHVSGMAATSKEKDYAHLLFRRIEKRLPGESVCLRISKFAEFERHPVSLDQKLIDSLTTYQPDLIIFQLGENVKIRSKSDELLFQEKYIELINSFKKNGDPQIICTTPFFPSLLKDEIIEEVALSTNSYLVDLSHLPLLNSENYAKNEEDYDGDRSDWKVSGIGIHPGDIGMENIAEQIFLSINAIFPERVSAEKERH